MSSGTYAFDLILNKKISFLSFMQQKLILKETLYKTKKQIQIKNTTTLQLCNFKNFYRIPSNTSKVCLKSLYYGCLYTCLQFKYTIYNPILYNRIVSIVKTCIMFAQ